MTFRFTDGQPAGVKLTMRAKTPGLATYGIAVDEGAVALMDILILPQCKRLTKENDLETVIRGAAIYVILLIVMRLSGRRTLAQMSSFDLVLLLIVAETTQQAMLTDHYSLVNAFVLIVTLFTLNIVLSHLKRRSGGMQLILEGTPTVLVSQGKPDQHSLQRARVNIEEVLEATREQGLGELDQIKFAVLEVAGTISIIPEAHPPDQ